MRLSDSEWLVMNAVWDRGEATARQVLDAVVEQTGWAYTTVRTVLSRLTAKKALRERQQGNASVYAPRIDRAEARRSALRSLVERAFAGSAESFVQHLVAEEPLTAADRRRLRELLGEAGRRKERGR
jgi:predicted transcriptional regulator